MRQLIVTVNCAEINKIVFIENKNNSVKMICLFIIIAKKTPANVDYLS